MTAAILYILATPIGNLQDISLRGLDALRQITVIAAEDTRVARRLLSAHNIRAPRLLSLRAHNEQRGAAKVVSWLQSGCSVLYLTDAGTPAVSDPGARLAAAVRAAGFSVSPLPGASALTAFLSVAGLPDDAALHFYGFLPAAASKRKKQLTALRMMDGFSVFYEAPHRIVAVLNDLSAIMGARQRIVLGRELTKQYEQVVDSTVAEVAAAVQAGTIPARGEFVFAVENPLGCAVNGKKDAGSEDTVSADGWRVFQQLLPYLPPRRAAAAAAKITAANAKALYALHLEERDAG